MAVTLEGEESGTLRQLRVEQRHQRFELDLAQRPLRIDIDPEYDVLRYLDPTEQPPALNRLFGGDTWLVIPTAAPQPMQEAWKQLAQAWKQRYPDLRTIADEDADGLDPRARLFVLGWDNRLFAQIAGRFARDGQMLKAREAVLEGQSHTAEWRAWYWSATMPAVSAPASLAPTARRRFRPSRAN